MRRNQFRQKKITKENQNTKSVLLNNQLNWLNFQQIARKAVRAKTLLRQVTTHPEICDVYHKNNLDTPKLNWKLSVV